MAIRETETAMRPRLPAALRSGASRPGVGVTEAFEEDPPPSRRQARHSRVPDRVCHAIGYYTNVRGVCQLASIAGLANIGRRCRIFRRPLALARIGAARFLYVL